MSGIETTTNDPSLAKGAKRAPHVREEAPVRWPSAATGSGAAYGVSHVPATSGGTVPDGCAEG